MDNMVLGTIIATVFSSIVAAIVSIYMNKEKKLERFDLQFQNILSYSMEYPYLEQKIFTDTWEPSLITQDEKYQRYNIYCSIVFNFIYDICLWNKYKQKKIDNYISIKKWLRKHEKCWKQPVTEYENIDIYGKQFTDFVKNYI